MRKWPFRDTNLSPQALIDCVVVSVLGGREGRGEGRGGEGRGGEGRGGEGRGGEGRGGEGRGGRAGSREGGREGDGRKDMTSRNGKESKCIDYFSLHCRIAAAVGATPRVPMSTSSRMGSQTTLAPTTWPRTRTASRSTSAGTAILV